VSKLCDRLISRFVRRVTRDSSATVDLVDTDHVRTASVVVSADSSLAATTPLPSAATSLTPAPPDPGQVFDKLERIFSFLGGALADVRLTDDDGGCPAADGAGPVTENLAGRLGAELVARMFDCVYTDCLSHIIQSSDTSWPTLDKILQLSERFQTNITRHLQLQVCLHSM